MTRVVIEQIFEKHSFAFEFLNDDKLTYDYDRIINRSEDAPNTIKSLTKGYDFYLASITYGGADGITFTKDK